MSIGKYTYGTHNLNIHYSNSSAKLTIGNFCSIAGNINVYLGGNHRTDWVTTYPFGHINNHIFNNFNGEGHPAFGIISNNDCLICSQEKPNSLYFL